MIKRFARTLVLFAITLPFVACTSVVEVAVPPKAISPDPGILTGTLDNGFRYYLRSANGAAQNDRLEVRLVVKVGSLDEGVDQRGYAHLLEHMAYRGTESFSAQRIESLLSDNGLRWGDDINATTHYGATVYRFSLHQDDVQLLPELFELMAEWLDSLVLDPAAVAQEQRIVDAEWRERYGDDRNVVDPVAASAYAGSRYADRPPAGDLQNIRSASSTSIRQFWSAHYRPSNAALVISGASRPWQLEPLIQGAFARIDDRVNYDRSGEPLDQEVPLEAASRQGVMFYKDDALVELQSNTDQALELPQLSVSFISEHPPLVESAVGAAELVADRFRNQLLFNAYSYLLRDRISSVRECSAIDLKSSLLESGQTVEHVSMSLLEKDFLLCLSRAYEAVNAVKNSAMTEEEYFEFSKLFIDIVRLNSERFRNRNAVAIADGLVDMITTGEYLLSAWDMQNLLQDVVSELSRENLNKLIARIGESHRIVYVLTTNSDQAPAMASMIAAISSSNANTGVRQRSSVVYGSLKPDQSLLSLPALLKMSNDGITSAASELPVDPGIAKITATENYHEWRLGNGASVILVPDSRYDHVAVSAISDGGYATRTGVRRVTAKALPEFLSVNGVDGYTGRALRSIMSKRGLDVAPFVDSYSHGISASGRSADIPALLTLMNSYFGDPLIIEPHNSTFLQQLRTRVSFAEHVTAAKGVASTEVENRDFLITHRELFGSSAEFGFVFVGAVDPDELEKQLPRLFNDVGNLPWFNQYAGQSISDNAVRINRATVGTEVSVALTCSATQPLQFAAGRTTNPRDELRYHWELLADVVAERMRLSLREKLGLLYEIDSDIPASNLLLHRIRFSVAPVEEARAMAAFAAVLTDLATDGVASQELEGAIARDNRRRRMSDSDYQTVATNLAHRWLFSRAASGVDRHRVSLEQVNQLARCMGASGKQAMLDSYETYNAETPNKSDRQSALQQESPDRR